ncbi:MAG: hypothetical protein ACTHJ7_10230 [Candidatus Nitrosocosmicus sp.]
MIETTTTTRINQDCIISSNVRYYISIDIGKKNCVVCITDKDGIIIEETKYDNTLSDAQNFARYINERYGGGGRRIAVVESTAKHVDKNIQSIRTMWNTNKIGQSF